MSEIAKWSTLVVDHLASVSLGAKTIAAIAGALVALITLRKSAVGLVEDLKKSWRQARIRASFPRYLETYRSRLAEHAFRGNHPWIPPSRNLRDFLVRAQVSTEDGLRDFEECLHESLTSDACDVFAVTGSVGSGKSVALVLATEVAWRIRQGSERGPVGQMSKFLPVLITFVDLRMGGYDVMEVVKTSLVLRGFAEAESERVEICDLFLQDMLKYRRVLLLADSLDELASDEQRRALDGLLTYSVKFKIPCVFTSRDGALDWHAASSSLLACRRLRLAEFGQATIERYIKKWPFSDGGLGNVLIDRVRGEPALARICANPQLVTIICFLHSEHPERVLLKRWGILEECVATLLRRKGSSIQYSYLLPAFKAKVLASLAYSRIAAGVSPDDMPVTSVLAHFAKELAGMEPSGFTAETVLNELVRHTGLLCCTDSGSIRFVHQSFFEYFVAAHLVELPSGAEETLSLWRNDRVATEEILVIYAGKKNALDSAVAVAVREASPTYALRLLVALSNAPVAETEEVIERAIAEVVEHPTEGRVDGLCQFILSQRHCAPLEAASKCLPLVARCEATLVDLFGDSSRCEQNAWLRETVLRALLLAQAAVGVELLVDAIEDINLTRVLPILVSKTVSEIRKQLEPRFSETKIFHGWIDALQMAQLPKGLADTFVTLHTPVDLQRCALSLLYLSHLDEFWDALDGIRLNDLERLPRMRDTLARWQWNRPEPRSAGGKIAAVALCRLVADQISETALPFAPLRALDVHRWIYFLTHAIAWEDFYNSPVSKLEVRASNIQLFGMICQSTPALLHVVWERGDRFYPDPEHGVVERVRILVAFAPALLLWLSVLSVTKDNNVMSWTAVGLITITIAGAWLRVFTSSKKESLELSLLDIAISSAIGPIAVLREVRFGVLSKRYDDRMAVLFCVWLCGIFGVIAFGHTSLLVRILALASIVDAIWATNRIVGLRPILSHQTHVLNDFLRNGTSAAVQ